jgi:Lrp/AsnC family leucine-responsive transcriptional regulator
MKLKIDKLDLQILKRLQETGRMTNLQLSQEVGLSPAPTLERVKKLETYNLIKNYHAQLNVEALGIGIKAFIMVTLDKQTDEIIRAFKEAIVSIDEIVECYQITGNADYQLKIMVKDIASFERLIAEKLSKIEQIKQMQTMVILSTIKESKVAPINYNETIRVEI